ncbi:MAG: PQQ-binding-like beta-propeller repeat protein [Planctomycetota bacterium]|nr:PQQ-binding-like beta-propeller repeat protein [Planctomycetota bacterium]
MLRLLPALALLGLASCGSSAPKSAAPAPIPDPPPAADPGWNQFRGPTGMGLVLDGAEYPREWDAASGKNILWKIPLDAFGYSSPIVRGGRVYLTGEKDGLGLLMAFDAATGAPLWNLPGAEKPDGEGDPRDGMSSGLCASTPATDGSRVFALFSTADLLCADPDGRVLWKKNLGAPENAYGLASSPVLWKDKLLIQFDRGNRMDGGSELLALRPETGEVLWSAPRPVPNSWSTPLVVSWEGRDLLVTCANPYVIAYDPAGGRELWRAKGLAGDVAPMPVFAAGLVFAATADSRLFAIRAGGSGDVTASGIAWTGDAGMPSMASPLTDGTRLLLCEAGELTCLEVRTGKLLWTAAAGEAYWASPVLAGRAVYLPEKSGRTFVFELGDAWRPGSEGNIGEALAASPAFHAGRIYLRGEQRLYCVGRAK